MKKSFYCSFALLLLVIPCCALTLASQTLNECSTCQSSTPDHVLVGGYYNTRDFHSSLVLNNKGPKPLSVRMTAFALKGEPIDLGQVELNGNQVQVLNIGTLLSGYGRKLEEGTIELAYQYDGCPLVLSAGVTLEDSRARVAFDHLLSRTTEFVGRSLEAVWWIPSWESKFQLIVTNRADEVFTASITVTGAESPGHKKEIQVALAPRETRILNVPRVFTIPAPPNGRSLSGSITVWHTGNPGQVVARCLVEDRSMGYSSSIEFRDPDSAVSSRLHGSGLRLGKLGGQSMLPVVVVRNLSDVDSWVTLRIPYTDRQGEARVIDLPEFLLTAHEVRDLTTEVTEQTGVDAEQLLTAGLEVSYSTTPGSVLVFAQVVSADGDSVFRVPMIDPDTKGSAGTYPWRLEGSSTTYIHLKNVTESVQEYTMQLDFEGGSYVLGLKKLRPGETVTLDVAELLDNQRPDEAGNTIPHGATSGQVHWSVIGTDNHSMIGRSEQVDWGNGFATTFACSQCCPNSFNDAWINPNPWTVPMWTSQQFYGHRQDMNCYGTLLSAYLVGGIWSSDNVQVLVFTSPDGQSEPINTGYTIVVLVIQVVKWVFNGPSQGCVVYQHQEMRQSGGWVVQLNITQPTAGTPHLLIDATPQMPAAVVKARVLGYTGGTVNFQWTYTAGFTADKWGYIGKSYSFNSSALGSDETSATVPFNGEFFGGDVSVKVVVQVNGKTLTDTKVHKIKGVQPSPTSVINEVNSRMAPATYWFATRMAKHETDLSPTAGGYAQFMPDGMPRPNAGGDGGYGIFQLTPPLKPPEIPDAREFWNWKQNIVGGKRVLDEKKTLADSRWTERVDAWTNWNNQHPSTQIPAPGDQTVGGFTFSHNAVTGKKSFRDAIWIKKWNGVGDGDYLIWRNAPDPFTTNPRWEIKNGKEVWIMSSSGQWVKESEYCSGCWNYVERICITQP